MGDKQQAGQPVGIYFLRNCRGALRISELALLPRQFIAEARHATAGDGQPQAEFLSPTPGDATGIYEMKRLDLVGLVMAGACAVHCLAMPLVLVYLPSLGLHWLTDGKVHYTLLGAGITVGGSTFLPGYRIHRRAWIPAVAVCGLATMAYAAAFQEDRCCRHVPAGCMTDMMQTGHLAHSLSHSDRAGINNVDLPECCRTAHCVADEKVSAMDISASQSSLGIMTLFPRSWTPAGATLLIIAHILNLKFCGDRNCVKKCCAESE